MSNASFDLLQALVNMTPHGMAGDVHSQSQPVDTTVFMERVSGNASPLTVREKLVRSILHTYSADVPQQHQTFTN